MAAATADRLNATVFGGHLIESAKMRHEGEWRAGHDMRQPASRTLAPLVAHATTPVELP